MIRIARLSTSATSSAAAAVSPRAALAAARRAAPRAPAPAPAAAAQAAPASTAAAARRVAPAASARPAPTPTPAPAAAQVPEADAFPETAGIGDYANLNPASSSSSASSTAARPAARTYPSRAAPAAASAATAYRPTPKASPPLTELPGAGYASLPNAPIGVNGDEGGPTNASFRSTSHPGELGTKTLRDGYAFAPKDEAEPAEDWTTSFKGLSMQPFSPEVAQALLRPLEVGDVEIKPDGLLYLPEIKYRRTLNLAFGPGGWGMAPRGETHIGPKIVSREWGLVCLGRLVAIARGEQEYFDPSGIPTATEAAKSNALMRCCKDLGVASELWDPRFIREFKAKHTVEAMVEHVTQKKRRKLWRLKDSKFEYPYKEVGPANFK